MAFKFNLKATAREGTLRALRRQDVIPAVLYGHGIKSQTLQVDGKAFAKIYRASGHTSLINLSLASQQHAVLVREVQLHPIKGNILHVDFHQVRMDEKISARVPLSFSGESSAVKDLGGVLVRNLDEIELEALPQNLPHDIEVDISVLDAFDKPIHIADLNLPPGVDILHEPGEVVALVQPPRTEEELEAELAEETEDVTGIEGIKEEEKPTEGEEGSAADQEKTAVPDKEEPKN